MSFEYGLIIGLAIGFVAGICATVFVYGKKKRWADDQVKQTMEYYKKCYDQESDEIKMAIDALSQNKSKIKDKYQHYIDKKV
jgi:gas vesicle protein